MNSKVVVAMLLAACPMGAQAIVRGAVMTEQGQRIAGVVLQVPSLKKSVRTDSTGEYRLDLPPGTYRMTTRAMGFFSLSDSIQPEKDVELIHDFTLTSLAKVLDTVSTTAPRLYFSQLLRGFEERRKTAQGHYITEEQFRRYRDRMLADVMRRVPGLQVRPGRGGANFATATRNGVAARNACFVSVYLDGLPLYTGLRGELPLDLNTLQTNTMAGAEFYPTIATSPVQFKDRTGCGLLLLWTREQ